jgi:hypothetical protein
MPCHHALAEALHAYIAAAGIAEDRKGWLFRTNRGHDATVLCGQPMNQSDAWRMIRRRAVTVGVHAPIGNHTFRATGITAYLANGGALEHAQEMAAESRARPSSTTGRRSGSRKTKSRGYGSNTKDERKNSYTGERPVLLFGRTEPARDSGMTATLPSPTCSTTTMAPPLVLPNRDRYLPSEPHSPSRCKREVRSTPQLKSTASDHFTVMV